MTNTSERGIHPNGETTGGLYPVLVLDDNPIIQYGFERLIATEPDVTFAAGISCSKKARNVLKTQKISLVLLDLDLNDGQAFQLIKDTNNPVFLNTKILAYSSTISESQIARTLHCGANGYVCKNADTATMREAIRSVLTHGSFIDPVVTNLVIRQFGRQAKRKKFVDRRLTNRERSVLYGIAEGKRNRDIANDLYISERTVKYHLSSLFQKLEVNNRTEAARFAFENGLLQ